MNIQKNKNRYESFLSIAILIVIMLLFSLIVLSFVWRYELRNKIILNTKVEISAPISTKSIQEVDMLQVDFEVQLLESRELTSEEYLEFFNEEGQEKIEEEYINNIF